MEGVTPVDSPEEIGDDYFLGVDLAEYYHGDNFASATRIVVSQLKYSTRHPDRAWTASRLCAGQRAQTTVIRRLVDVYKGFLLQASRIDILRKLHIRLISNQPADPDLTTAIQASQAYLRTIPLMTPTRTARLLKALPAQHHATIQQLLQRSGFSSTEFTDFLRVLDLDSLGAEARAFQRLRLLQELNPLVNTNPVANLRALCDLIAQEALPERAQSTGLTANDVLACLEARDPDHLFPAPSKLLPPVNLIKTNDARGLAALIASSDQHILAHGNAGVGKTTTVQTLRSHLPEGSVVIAYDCFGGGSYLEPGEQRHIERRAFLQMTNELALECGTPFLLQPAHEAADLQRNFRRSLEAAARIVAETQGALLILVIDAADNAVVAAQQFGDESFVSTLWRMRLPANCRLLMTCRSHRRRLLGAAAGVREYELVGFDNRASCINLRSVFPEASDVQCSAFHMSTGGIPRVQEYLLAQKGSHPDHNDALEQLLAAPRLTLTALFDDLWNAAVTYTPNQDQAGRHLAILLALMRPIFVREFSTVCGLNMADAEDFCRALIPGLRLEHEEISFRDEDFETYLRSKLSAEQLIAAHDQIGTAFLRRVATDVYAARHIADHLFAARRYSDLITLILQGPDLNLIEDNLLRLQVTQRRLTLALKAVQHTDQSGNAVRLLLLSAETAQSDDAVTELVRANPELAAVFGDTESVSRLYMREENANWLGPAYLRTAAMIARDPMQRERGQEQFDAAEAWIRRWIAMPRNERHRWQIGVVDVASGVEALFWLEGAEAAEQWLRRWRPPHFILDVVRQLAVSLAPQLTDEQLALHLRSLTLPPWIMGAILAEVWEAGRSVPIEIVQTTAERLVAAIEQGKVHQELAKTWPVAFCEFATSSGVALESILNIVQALCPPFPSGIPSEHDTLSDYDAPLRAICLRAALVGQEVTTAALLPETYRRTDSGTHDYRYESERRRFDETIGKVLRIYVLRARVITSQLLVSDVADDITNDLKPRQDASEHRWFRFDRSYRLWAHHACDLLIRCAGDAELLLRAIADTTERVGRASAPSLWIDMADLLIRQPPYRALAYQLLSRASDYVMSHPLPGRDRWEILLRCAAVVSRYDRNLAHEYYMSGLTAAEGIDDNSALLLAFLARAAQAATPHLPSEERRSTAARLAHLVEAHEGYVSEDSRLPRKEVLKAVTYLYPPSGFALCSRWDDENRLHVDDGIPVVVQTSVEQSFLSPLDGLALLRLAGTSYDVSKDACLLLDRLLAAGPASRPQLVQALQTISIWIRRDVPLRIRVPAATRIVAWAEANGLHQLGGISELKALISFAQHFLSNTSSSGQTSFRLDAERETRVNAILAQAQRASLEDIDTHLRSLWSESYGGQPVHIYLATVGQAVPTSQRVAFLTSIVSSAGGGFLSHYVAQALVRFLQAWYHVPAVRAWAPDGVRDFLMGSLPYVLRDYEPDTNLNALLSVPPLQGQPRVALLLPAIIQHLNTLGPRALYVLAELLALSLDGTELARVLDWSLSRMEQTVLNDGKALPTSPRETLPESADAAVAHFLWALFGHADKQVRWLALHAARELLRPASRRLLPELISLLPAETAGRFRSDTLDFYWMSARTWLLLLLLRLAEERPADLYPHVQLLAEHAINAQFPHVQIRELARRIVLKLLSKTPSLLPPEQAEQLQFINLPVACMYPSPQEYTTLRERSGEALEEGDRFQFWFDTEGYWYAHLARIFERSTREIVKRAEFWICDRWGRTNDDWWRDPRELSDRYERRGHGFHRGEVPPIENLRTYLEYHAMFCAAGEMAAMYPMAVRLYDDGPSQPWDEWLRDHVGASAQYWLADLRVPAPYRPDCWGQFPPLQEWLQNVDPAEYDAALGFDESGHPGEMVVLAHHTVGDDERQSTVRVKSALVNPHASHALMRALQTTDPNDFMLPVDNYGPEDRQISESGFELRAWLRNEEIQNGLDQYDPCARLETSNLSAFGHDFLTFTSAQVSAIPILYTKTDGSTIGRLEIWNDSIETERITQPYSHGERLWVRLDLLIRYLAHTQSDLIISVEIERNQTNRGTREEDYSYDRTRAAIYLLHADGTLETVAGSRQIGASDRR